MAYALKLMRDRFDRLGLVLSGMCAVHCLATLALVTLLGLGGGILLNPAIHRVGLALAILVGAVGLGLGFVRHARCEPLVVGIAGLILMGLALGFGHGPHEAVLTIAGVGLVACAHWRNVCRLT